MLIESNEQLKLLDNPPSWADDVEVVTAEEAKTLHKLGIEVLFGNRYRREWELGPVVHARWTKVIVANEFISPVFCLRK